ncbi:peptidase S14 [Phragmitibacter flavus]|uniref:Peptidase S14 n=2 Tax=Phragmitibacter flavus TaxID=2576071 RepID=A0A5R8KEY9_9BACT|nr:peptidase S14 [Phragmitibacter flavus]
MLKPSRLFVHMIMAVAIPFAAFAETPTSPPPSESSATPAEGSIIGQNQDLGQGQIAALTTISPAAAPTVTTTSPSVTIETKVTPDSSNSDDPAVEKLGTETARLAAEKDKILAELALAQARLDAELAPGKQKAERLAAQLAELKAAQDLEDFQRKVLAEQTLGEFRVQLEKATLISTLAKAEVETEIAEIKRMENVIKKDTTRLAASMELEEKQADPRNYANNQPIYLENPLKDGNLVLSDRRIPLNGLIGMRTANDIVDRINYFNNRDRNLPIFIVIDDSPGGSVMAGYKILKAMQGSEAPVYTVVKSFAASMAACITTLAEKSFAYPNAVILHHQIASFSGGNLTQQQEWVREMEEWWKRLAGPVADKMGITREEFIKRMYAKSSSGDWNEFADEAQKLKWVDVVVEEIEETGTLRLPEDSGTEPSMRRLATSTASADPHAETTDAKGRPSMLLPRLNPFDCYWLYNPDGYYKLP